MNETRRFIETLELLNRAKRGDELAEALLLERYRPRLLARIRLMMGNAARRHADSTDFLQQLMVDILGDLASFVPRDESSFLHWATQIARNNIRDEVRRRRERALESFSSSGIMPRSSTTPSRIAARAEDITRLIEALERLSPDHRRIIELRDLDGLPYREVARALGRKTEEAAQMLHARALTRLTEILAP